MSEPRPAIAYIVAAWNASRTLGETLGSLRRQTRDDWEAIVVDDSSEDATLGVALSVRDARVVGVRQRRAGPGAARNRGLALARAGVVCFLDADDLVEPAHAEAMLDALGDADAVACDYRLVGAGGEDLDWVVRARAADHDPARLLAFSALATGATVLRLDAVRRAGGLSVRCGHEDWDLVLRLAAAGARWADPVGRALFRYRLTPGSRSAQAGERWRDGLDLIARHAPDADARHRARREWSIRSLAQAMAGRDDEAVGAILSSLRAPGSATALSSTDSDVLAGALAWAFPRAEGIAPARAGERAARWRAVVERALAGEARADAVLAALDRAWIDWRGVARAARDRLLAGDRLVLFGMGRNGQALSHELASLGVPFECIDDAGERPASIGPTDLADHHVVIVTPHERSAILPRLRGRRVWLPEELAREAPAASRATSEPRASGSPSREAAA